MMLLSLAPNTLICLAHILIPAAKFQKCKNFRWRKELEEEENKYLLVIFCIQGNILRSFINILSYKEEII